MTEKRQESKFVLASRFNVHLRISLPLSLSLFLGRQTKLNLSVSVPLAGQGLESVRHACATAGGTHVPTNSSAMSQCATVCRNFAKGGCESTGGDPKLSTWIWICAESWGEAGLHVVLPACSLHVTRLNEK